MPKLLLFTPCLKAIGGDDGLLTIVSVLEFVGVNIPQGESLEENSIVRLQWQMVALWNREAGDADGHFEQTVEFILPSGVSVYSNAYPLHLVDRNSRVRIDGDTFPVGLPGEVIIRIGCRRQGTAEIEVAAEYPVLVMHNRQTA